jgi:hypothetical protein
MGWSGQQLVSAATVSTTEDDADGQMMAEIAEGLQVGPRGSCSPGERALGALVSRRLEAFCDTVTPQPFTCHPLAFLGFIPAVTLLTLVSLALVSRTPMLAAGLGLISAVVTIGELLLYIELVDPLFPRREGVNIVGVIRPTGPVRRRIVLSAHQDSAFEFNLWYWFKTLGVPVNILGLGAPLLSVIGGGLAAAGLIEADALLWPAALLAPFAALHLAFHNLKVVPGAMDDLAGLAVITAVGRHFARARLTDTELVILACSSEECGLRGARRYVAASREALLATPTHNINVDGVYDERFLTVITRELTTGAVHDPALIQLTEQISEQVLDRPIKRAIIPFGATDATEFARAGISSVSLLCQDTARLAPNYHTRLDTFDRVRPESLSVMRRLVVALVQRLDEPVSDGRAARET